MAGERVGALFSRVGDGQAADSLGQCAVGLGMLSEHLGQQFPDRHLVRGGRRRQLFLGAAVLDHLLADRPALVLIAVKQPRSSRPVHLCGQLPAEVHCVLNPQVEPLATLGRVDVAASPASIPRMSRTSSVLGWIRHPTRVRAPLRRLLEHHNAYPGKAQLSG